MTDQPRETLCELIATYGPALCDDPRRCEALLRDLCGTHRREIHVLVSALRERVAADLLAASEGVPREVLRARLTQRLHDNLGLTEDLARWAVDSWALALGKLSRMELGAVSTGSSTTCESVSAPSSRRRPLIVASLWVGVGFLVLLGTAVLYRGEQNGISTEPPAQFDQGIKSSNSSSQGAGQAATELGEYVKLFMLGGSHAAPSWDLGADRNRLPLKWLTNGVEETARAYSGPIRDQYSSFRKGEARIQVNGEVFWAVKRDKEEVGWEITMWGHEKFGPDRVHIAPKDDCFRSTSSGCYFDVEKMFTLSGIQFVKLCDQGLVVLYEIQAKGKKSAYVVYFVSTGSGGTSSYLTLHWTAPRRTKDAMCDWLGSSEVLP